MLTYMKFKKTVREYAEVYDFPRPSVRICKNLWEIYSQNINANCHDVTVDIAQFLDQRHDMLNSIPTPTSTLGYSIKYSTWDAVEAPAQPEAKCCKKEEENSMTDTYKTERDYLNRRLSDAQYVKDCELSNMFRIHNSEVPKNYKELIDAIKNDKFTLDEKRTRRVDAAVEETGYSMHGPFYGIEFDIPSAPDRKGYEAACVIMLNKWSNARDTINVCSPSDGLKALQDFEAWQPTKVG